MQQRQPAHRIWVYQVMQGSDETTPDEAEPYAVSIEGKKVSRVSILGTVVDSYTNADGSFSSVTLDDGTATIRMKAFKEDIKKLASLKVGDLVHCLGRLRKFNDERYIIPETVKLIDDPHWLLQRWLELAHTIPPRTPQIQTSEPQPKIQESEVLQKKILDEVSRAGEDGMSLADLETALQAPRAELIKKIDDLINDGEIYQFKPGHYKRI